MADTAINIGHVGEVTVDFYPRPNLSMNWYSINLDNGLCIMLDVESYVKLKEAVNRPATERRV